MKITAIAPAILLMILTCWQTSAGQQSSGMQFLNLGPNAKALSLSEAHTAASIGASSLYTNPAMLSFESQSSGTLSYMTWGAVDTRNSHAAVNLKRDTDAFGFGIVSSMVDHIEQRNVPGSPTGTIDVLYFSLAAAYSRHFGPASFGITGMYLYEQLYQQNAGGYAFSAGSAVRLLDDRVRVAMAILNVGEMNELNIEATKLPSSFRFGTEIQAIQFSVSGTDEIPLLLLVNADFVQPISEIGNVQNDTGDILSQNDPFFNFAISLEISDVLTLRSGYKTGHPERNFTLGGGIKIGNIDFDYAFIPFNTGFGAAHAISLGYYF